MLNMPKPHIQALNLAKSGDWNQSHTLIQDYTDTYACLIHGYLHRVEGDLGNARYWYNRAGEPMLNNTLEEEWERLFCWVDPKAQTYD